MKLILLSFLLAAQASFAGYKTSIIDVWEPTEEDAFASILAADGQVYHIDKENIELIEKAQIAKEVGKVECRRSDRDASRSLRRRFAHGP